MDEVDALMSQALATVAMASAISAAAELAPITATNDSMAPIAAPPARAITATTSPSKIATTAIATAATPQQRQEQASSSAFREVNAANIELRSFANEIDDRWEAAIEALYAASRAVASPGEELNRSYEAYCRAYRFLRAAEASVRDAEGQEDAAINKLRRAGEIVDATKEEVAWAAKALRVFDAGRDNHSSHNASKSDTVKKKRKTGGGGGGGGGDDDDDDDDDEDCYGNDRDGAPPPAVSDEAYPLRNRTHQHSKSRQARERLRLTLETAGINADRALAEQHRVTEEGIAVMTLVGARTAGEWSLAAEACDTAHKRFQRARLEALPKIKLFSERARHFRILSRLKDGTRERLGVASQAREAARIEVVGRWQ